MDRRKGPARPGVSRRAVVLGGAALGATLMTGCQTAAPEPPHPILGQALSVDLHAHLTSRDRLRALTDSQVSGAVCSFSADGPVIGRTPQGRIAQNREPGRDELYDHARQQLADARRRLDEAGIVVARSAAELRSAHAARRKFAVLAIEGGDFAAEDLGRIEEMYKSGVRTVQPLHYTDGPFGDIQTTAARHAGLSGRGREFIAEMKRLGMLVDLAHMSFDAARQAIEASGAPAMFSHGMVSFSETRNYRRSRFFGTDYARMIARSGGVLGVWPVTVERLGINTSIDAFAETAVRTVDLIGIDHVGIGTDLFGAPMKLTGYRDWNVLVDRLTARGVARPDLEKLLGGNFLRVFAAATDRAA